MGPRGPSTSSYFIFVKFTRAMQERGEKRRSAKEKKARGGNQYFTHGHSSCGANKTVFQASLLHRRFQYRVLQKYKKLDNFALNFAYDRKMAAAAEECRQQGIVFLPLAAESVGGWHQTAEREVKKLGSALARHTGQLEGEAISHLWGRLGMLLQRGNAAILGNRVPALPDPHIDGIF